MKGLLRIIRRLGIRHKLGYARVAVRCFLHPLPPKGKFPAAGRAVKRPAGLVAIGGAVTADTVLEACRNGIYPLYFEPPARWWSNDPRAVLFIERFHIGRRLRALLRRNLFRVTFDQAFGQVVKACGNREPTWITPELAAAYEELHRRGYAHSIEAWLPDGTLAGGVLGIALGRVFLSESAFHVVDNASKVASVVLNCHLLQWGYVIKDIQTMNAFAESMGCEAIPRSRYLQLLADLCDGGRPPGKWEVDGCGDACQNCSNSFKDKMGCNGARIIGDDQLVPGRPD